MRRILARLATATAIAVVVIAGVLLALLPSGSEQRAHSVLSRDGDGLRALYLLTEALGFPVRVWSAAPGALDGPGRVLVLAHVPPDAPPGPPRAETDGAEPVRGRDRSHYGRFVAEGGRLVLVGVDADALAFLRAAGVELGALDTVDEGSARLRADPGDELDVATRRGFTDPPQGTRVLARDESGTPVALVVPAETGAVALTTVGADAFTNTDLGLEAGAAVLFVRILEALGPADAVLFDEYALGGWQPDSLAALAFSPRLAWLSAHVLLLVALLGWLAAFPGPFARDPEPLLAGSPLARARGLARTCERAGRHDLLARLLRRGFLERWCARTGLRAPPASARVELDPERLAETLAALARGDARLRAALDAAFGGPAVADDAGLERAARALDALDARLFPEAAPGAPAARERISRRTLGAPPARSGSSARS